MQLEGWGRWRAGGVQEKEDEEGDAKQRHRERGEERTVYQKGESWRHSYGAGFPIQQHRSPKQLSASATGQRPPPPTMARGQARAPTSCPLPCSRSPRCWVLCPALPCRALIYGGGLPRAPGTAGFPRGALQPRRTSGTSRSCSSACCFGAATSQPAFDTS